MDDEECKQKIAAKNYDALVACDQLSIEKNEGRVFVGYDEGKIAFAPTYKFDSGTDIYDTSYVATSLLILFRLVKRNVHPHIRIEFCGKNHPSFPLNKNSTRCTQNI